MREATNVYTNTLTVGLTVAFSGGCKDIINNVGIILLYLPPLISIKEIENLIKEKSWQALATNSIVNSKKNPGIQDKRDWS